MRGFTVLSANVLELQLKRMSGHTLLDYQLNKHGQICHPMRISSVGRTMRIPNDDVIRPGNYTVRTVSD